MRFAIFQGILAILFLAGSALPAAEPPFRVTHRAPVPELDALFRTNETWSGADGNYSLPLNDRHVLWFFSDTWIGKLNRNDPDHPTRAGARLINNSIGVWKITGEQPKVSIHWETAAGGEPAASLKPPKLGGWYWPLAGTFERERGRILLWRMEKAPGSDAFGFRLAGSTLAEIENPLEAPSSWRVTYHDVPHFVNDENERMAFGSAICTTPEFNYIYGYRERRRDKSWPRTLVTARVPRGELTDFKAWRFWTGSTWSDDFREAASQVDGVASECSVTFDPKLERYLLVYHDAFLSPQVVARAAEQPWGPWSEKVVLFTSPDVRDSKTIFCYSGKAHGWLSPPGELVITHAANSLHWPEVVQNAELYWPRFTRVRLEK